MRGTEIVELLKLAASFAFLISQKALIVENEKLLVLGNTLDDHSGGSSWELPGGLLEMNEPLVAGILREVLEETGLTISVGRLFATWDHWHHGFIVNDGRKLDVRIVGLAYICKRVDGDVTLSYEHQMYRWASREELRKLPLAPNSDIAIRAFVEEDRTLV
jgi:8-oxo-dGTP diphosphatase